MVAGLETHLTLMKFIIALLDLEVKPVLRPLAQWHHSSTAGPTLQHT